jgi:hypothetical protein
MYDLPVRDHADVSRLAACGRLRTAGEVGSQDSPVAVMRASVVAAADHSDGKMTTTTGDVP